MNKLVQRRLDMARRVRAFLRAHPLDGEGDSAALTRFEELVARAETLGAQQEMGRVTRLKATTQREELRRELESRLLRYLVAVATTATRDTPDLMREFQLPGLRASNQKFITAARRMLNKAAEHRDRLVAAGMSSTLLEDLARAVGELEATFELSFAARRDQVGASGSLQEVGREIILQARVLDGLVRYRLGVDAELMTAWGSARDVFGPVRRRNGGPDAGDGVVPDAGGGGPVPDAGNGAGQSSGDGVEPATPGDLATAA